MSALRNVICGCLALAVLATPTAGSAQFGGALRVARGVVGGEASVSSGDAESFLSNATRSTKNIMISASLLAQLLTDKDGLAGQKAYIDNVQGRQDIGELGALRSSLRSNLDVLAKRENLAADLSGLYNGGTEEQRRVMTLALGNLAIGIFRNVQLAEQAPGIVSGIGANPRLLTRVGDFRLAAELIGIQAAGLGGIASSLPALFSAAQIEMPDQAETTEPREIIL